MPLKNNSLILLILLIAGCKQMPQLSVPTLPGLGPRKIEIQQGNVITQEMVDKLQPGMTRNQVRFVLGTPLLVDPFRTDRWDYVYTMNKGGQLVEQRQLKVFFQDDKMLRYEGDVVSEAKTAAKPADKSLAQPVVKPVVAPVAAVQPAPAAAAAAVTAKPAAPAPAGAVATDIGTPQLRMAPAVGEAGPSAVTPPAAAVAPVPREPETIVAPPLDTPPLPRLVIQPEQADQTAQQPAPKPAVKPAEKPAAGPGFFGRLFGAKPVQAAQPSAPAAVPVTPAAPPTPVAVSAPVEKPLLATPVEKPAEKPLAAAPAQKPADKPVAGRGFFGRLADTIGKPAPPVSFGREREAQPGSPPPPFVDPDPASKKP